MAIATTSTTTTGPSATYVYTEFGTPETGTPGTYGWLGGDQISSDALGGQRLMGVRAYNSDTGRFSQTDPIAGGSANSYDYGTQNPLTELDLTGMWWEFMYSENYYSAWYQVYGGGAGYWRGNIWGIYSSLPIWLLEFVRYRMVYSFYRWVGGDLKHRYRIVVSTAVQLRQTWNVMIGSWRLFSWSITYPWWGWSSWHIDYN